MQKRPDVNIGAFLHLPKKRLFSKIETKIC